MPSLSENGVHEKSAYEGCLTLQIAWGKIGETDGGKVSDKSSSPRQCCFLEHLTTDSLRVGDPLASNHQCLWTRELVYADVTILMYM